MLLVIVFNEVVKGRNNPKLCTVFMLLAKMKRYLPLTLTQSIPQVICTDWKYVVTAIQLKLCLMKHMQRLIVHYSVI